jgi:HSP20 family protein
MLDRRQLEQIRSADPELERRFRTLLENRTDELDAAGAFTPPTDLVMTDKELVVVMELAGIRREDVRLSTGLDELVVQGRRREVVEADKERWLAMEISTGGFERRIPLPAGLLMEEVAASYRDGLLLIRIPRQEGSEVTWHGEEQA